MNPVIPPQRNVPIQDPDSPDSFSLPWYRFFQSNTGGSLTPAQIAALEAEIAAAAAEAAAASATASMALSVANTALSEADGALLIALVDLSQTDG